MGRPAKSAAVTAKHLTDEERKNRLAGEQSLQGENKKVTPPRHLTKEQKKIFKFIVKELENAQILCALDSSVLAQCAVAVDMLRYIDVCISEDPTLLGSTAFMSSRKQYMSDFFRCSNELCLSPQSRAKLANMNAAAAKTDPLIEALRADDDEGEDEDTADFDSVDEKVTADTAGDDDDGI